MTDDLEIKTSRLIEIAEKKRLGGILINSRHNFAWLTGGGDNGIDSSRENGSASIFVRRDGKRYVIANNIETERITNEEIDADQFDVRSFPWADEKGDPLLAARFAKDFADNASIGSDLSYGSVAEVIEADIANVRRNLTENELDRITELGSDAWKAFKNTIEKLNLGVTEYEAASVLRAELAVFGINSVVTLAAADNRIAKYRHPVPKQNRWKKMLMLVACAQRKGLIVSLSRIICAGEIPSEINKRLEANAFVNASLYDATRAGVSGAELYNIANAAYIKTGYGDEINNHHQGGCAAYKTREWVAHPNSKDIVNDDQAFAWNPSITGVKVEETITLTDGEIKVITSTPDHPCVETEINGKTYRSPGILSL